jgi:hypothetical protein
MKKIFRSGTLYLLIAVLFALGALNKTISDNSFVTALQWMCALIFAVLGFLQLRKRMSR